MNNLSLFRFLPILFMLALSYADLRGQCSLVSISGPNGADPLTLCDGGPTPDKLCFKASSYASRIRFVITDVDGNLITDFNKQCVDFGIFPSGVSRVYAISYAYFFTGEPGDNIFTDTIAGYCQTVSENFIEIVNSPAGGGDAGEVSLVGGDTDVAICVADGQPDQLSFTNTAVLNGASFRYIVTDDQDVVTQILASNSGQFDDGDTGEARVYGLVYQGSLPVSAGDTLNPLNLVGCTSLSNNYVTIIKTEVSGGILLTDDGKPEIDLCPGDGVTDIVTVVASGISPAPYVYIVSDPNGLVLGVTGNPAINFDAYGPGNYVVWGLSYTGNLLAQPGDLVDVDQLADGCFELSEPVVVVSEDPVGGTVFLADGETEISICPGNGIADLLEFEKLTTSGAGYSFLLVDEQGIITHVLNGISAFDFEALPEGVSKVYGMSYVGDILAAPGMELATDILAEPCFDLSSNFILVNREVPEGGMVQLQSGGGDEVVVCSGDGQPDIIAFEAAGNSGGNYRFMLTDSFGNILSLLNDDNIDLDGTLGGDEWRIYGASYTGDFLVFLGDNVNMPLASDCYDLSDNYIAIDLQRVDGGVVYIPGNPVSYDAVLCPDGNAVIEVDSSNLGTVDYTFVVTDEENVIVDVQSNDVFDFAGVPEGVYRIHGLSFAGDLFASVGDTAGVDPLAENCESLSQNFITVTLQSPDAGQLTTAEGESEIEACALPGGTGTVEFVHTGTQALPYALVVVDEAGMVTQVSMNQEIDFEGNEAGDYTIYGVSYTGMLTVMVGDQFDAGALSDDCSDVSISVVSVTVFEQGGPCGGLVLYTECPSGNVGDEVCFPITVNGFTQIFGSQFSVHWNPDVLQFTGAQNFNSGITGLSVDNINAQNPGTAVFLWADLFLSGVTLPDSSVLFELCFEVVGPGTSDFTFDGNPVDLEFTTLVGLDVLTVPVLVEPCIFQTGFTGPDEGGTEVQLAGVSTPEVLLFPNPASFSTTLSWEQPSECQTSLHLYDAFGNIILSKTVDGVQGLNSQVIHTANLQPGMYWAEVMLKSGERKVKRFVKHD